MSSDDDAGYVHRPSGEPPTSGDGEREFDWRGWTLVATVIFAFIVAPGALLLLPAAQSFVQSLGLTLRDAYLVLPLLPAFLLGSVAVWSAMRARSGGA
ncbi:hypothetical protein IL252_13360 [Halomicrobium sp. IBSBa]|uniref:hypothetical protein n=1 Tax=Halomicrobium sp. IBSBa TaxID=2778916 RepID=UPI001ABFD834|nr:hypothetical protein [Halomicrobium sp. IBSBa]MBO4248806.1 hypothetical protein [Halomicrobium sp. IBSBa]